MSTTLPTQEELENSGDDLVSLDVLVNGTETEETDTRLGGTKPSYRKRLKENSSGIADETARILRDGGQSRGTLSRQLNLPVVNNPIFHGFARGEMERAGRPSISSSVSWSRTGTKSNICNGVYRELGAYQPSPSDFGWEITPASTNLVTYSEELSIFLWDTVNGATFTYNQEDPAGRNSSVRITKTSGSPIFGKEYRVNVGTGTIFTISGFFKSDNFTAAPGAVFILQASPGVTGNGALLNDVGITVDSFTGYAIDVDPEVIDYEIIRMQDGWFRLSLTTMGDNPAEDEIEIRGLARDIWTAIYFWGPQCELSPKVSPYIHTPSGVPVTRTPDTVTVAKENHPQVIAGQPLTMLVSLDLPQPNSGPITYRHVIEANGPYYSMFRYFTNGALVYHRDASAITFGPAATIKENTNFAVAVSSEDKVKTFTNGNREGTKLSTTPTSPGVVSSISIGADFNFHIRDFMIYDTELSEAQINYLHRS